MGEFMKFNLFELTTFKSLMEEYLKQYPESPMRLHELHGKILEGIKEKKNQRKELIK